MAKKVQDGQFSFIGGMDSYTNPERLAPNQYMYAENMVNRGDILQTRPNYNQVFSLPCGNFQGFTMFTPTDGTPQMVWAVDGIIYVSEYPYLFYRTLPNIQFYRNAKYLAWAVCQQKTTYNDKGELIVLNEPRAILMMQDGFTRSAYYDGSTNMHLNPSPSGVVDADGEAVVLPNTYGTPIGLWMAWSGNRLWVSYKNQLYASDIGNPLVFSEQIYLSGFNAFALPEPITGLVEPYYGAPLIVFGASTRTFIRSNIQDREQWAFTSDMQLSEYGIGCVSHRSIVRQYGNIWWYSLGGMVNLNQATQNLIDSYADYIDSPMIVSKSFLSPDLSGIAGVSFEKYLALSVPSHDTRNYHTWVLDQSDVQPGSGPLDTAQMSWQGVWTGTRPIEWGTMQLNGQARCFFASVDDDGVNRIWEAFLPDRQDNGMPITSVFQSRFFSFAEQAGSDNIKQYRWNRVEMLEDSGVLDIMGSFCSTRGAYVKNLEKRIVATAGTYAASPSSPTAIVSYKPQERVVDSREITPTDTPCNQCGVEEQAPYYQERAFGIMLICSGRVGITGLRLFAEWGDWDKTDGECTPDETGPNSLTIFGCEAKQAVVTEQPFETFVAVAEATAECVADQFGTGPTNGTGSAETIISQKCADKLALLRAEQDALDRLQCAAL